jgi:hypothetical protein
MTGNCTHKPSTAKSTYNINYFANFTIKPSPLAPQQNTEPSHNRKEALVVAVNFAYSVEIIHVN